jgi:hypothetical protein
VHHSLVQVVNTNRRSLQFHLTEALQQNTSMRINRLYVARANRPKELGCSRDDLFC